MKLVEEGMGAADQDAASSSGPTDPGDASNIDDNSNSSSSSSRSKRSRLPLSPAPSSQINHAVRDAAFSAAELKRSRVSSTPSRAEPAHADPVASSLESVVAAIPVASLARSELVPTSAAIPYAELQRENEALRDEVVRIRVQSRVPCVFCVRDDPSSYLFLSVLVLLCRTSTPFTQSSVRVHRYCCVCWTTSGASMSLYFGVLLLLHLQDDLRRLNEQYKREATIARAAAAAAGKSTCCST